jgi:sec-independent protein translocase protein TatA
MPHLGPMELVIILAIVLVIFGAGKLPEIGGALGKGIKEFKSATKEVEQAKKELSDVAKDVEADAKSDQA